jgi:hypothetical protein
MVVNPKMKSSALFGSGDSHDTAADQFEIPIGELELVYFEVALVE